MVVLKAKKVEIKKENSVRIAIPTLNDTEQEFHSIAEFILSVSENIPWHISAFYPAYKLKYLPPTPLEVLNRAREIGLETGLHNVYLGNVTNNVIANTKCPGCGEILIERTNFGIIKNKIQKDFSNAFEYLISI